MPELQRPGEIVRDVNKRRDCQNSLMSMTVTLSCLVGVAQDYNPESVEAKKLKTDLAVPSAFEVRALLCLTWADAGAGGI